MFEILIIDDDRSIQIFLQRILEKQGYEVMTASTGEEGILKTLDSSPALIICDWIMPGLSGIEVCNIIKKDPKLSTTFFILLTSLDSVADRVKGLDAGADDFITKPIEQNELQARVRAGLRLHQLSQDLHTQKQLLEIELAEATEYVKSLLPLPVNKPLSIKFKFLPSRQLGGAISLMRILPSAVRNSSMPKTPTYWRLFNSLWAIAAISKLCSLVIIAGAITHLQTCSFWKVSTVG